MKIKSIKDFKMRICILFLILNSCILNAQTKFNIELYGGFPYNPPINLIIKQNNFEDIKFKAKYYSEPFYSPYYWVARIGYWNFNNGIEIETIHHKIYLKNLTDEVQRFGISHGLNLISLNRAFEKNKFVYRIGIGTVIAHPENTIRNKPLLEEDGFLKMGYYICGLNSTASVSRYFQIFKNLKFSLEFKLNYSYSVVPIYEGKAYVKNFAIQSNFGLRYQIEV